MIALWLAYALLLGALFGLAASLVERLLRLGTPIEELVERRGE